jgi:hypothetical protein
LNYVPFLIGGGVLAGFAGYAITKNNPNDVGPYDAPSVAEGRKKNNEFLGATVGAAGAYLLVHRVRDDLKNHHNTEELLVQAENGSGKDLDKFTNKVRKDKRIKNFDSHVVTLILQEGNRNRIYCPGGLIKEDVILQDVKTKMETGWRPMSPAFAEQYQAAAVVSVPETNVQTPSGSSSQVNAVQNDTDVPR